MSAAANPAAPGSGGGRGPEEKGEGGVRGTDPRPHLELGWRVEAALRERAAAVGEWLRRRRCGLGGGARAGE